MATVWTHVCVGNYGSLSHGIGAIQTTFVFSLHPTAPPPPSSPHHVIKKSSVS